MSERVIQEKLLGEVFVNLWRNNGATTQNNRWVRVAVYDCPSDRRAIIKDVRAIWNPDVPDGYGSPANHAQAGDSRSMAVKINRTTICRTFVEDGAEGDLPDAIMEPNLVGGSQGSMVLEPGERLEVSVNIDVSGSVAAVDREDSIVVRASGVEVLL